MTEVKKLDKFHEHEALDRAAMILDMFGLYVAEHPYVESDPELIAQAEKVIDVMYDFYNLIGNKTLTDEDQN